MKRIVTFAVFTLGMVYFAQAQVNPRALGLRLGSDGDISGAEISYQHATGGPNRMEWDLGFGSSRRHNRIHLAAIYHWVWPITNGLNWYAGPGGSIGFHTYRDYADTFNMALGGQVGLEYDFNYQDAPILLSLDIRPLWDFIGEHAGLGWGLSLGIRYTW